MFEIGEKVVYGVMGTCEIVDIDKPPIKGIDKEYYFLQPSHDDKGIVYSPVDSNKVLMRPVIDEKDAKKLVERAKNCKKDEALNVLVGPISYDEYIKSQEPVKLMNLIRSLYNVKNERAKDLRKMKSADSRILVVARKLLYGELSVALGKDFQEITSQMDEYLSIQ